MKKPSLYLHKNCSTCKKALSFLKQMGLSEAILPVDITITPPSKSELQKMVNFYNGDIKALFNSSGSLYRELHLKDRLAAMDLDEAIGLLAENGMLVKRPFLIAEDFGVVGFREEAWKKAIAAIAPSDRGNDT